MGEKINYTVTKQYLKTGETPAEKPETLGLNQLQALILRREALLAKDHPEAYETLQTENLEPSNNLRNKSREILARSNEVLDFTVLEHIVSAQEINYDYIIDFLKGLNIKTLPILSTTPPEIQKIFKERFDFELISPDQVNLTDFNNIITESVVPETISNAPIVRKDYGLNFTESLKSRWFLILVVLLAVFSAVGFSLDWSLGLTDIIGPLDLYLSIYGITALTRSSWQINRAEKWNKKARGIIRSEYATSLESLTNNIPELNGYQNLLDQARKISNERLPWDTYQNKFGLREIEDSDGIIDKIIAKTKTSLTKDEITDQIVVELLQRKFGDNPPTVAVTIPTYKTSIEEMRDLLISIKNQAYPVNEVYIVYNDNPNDEEIAKRPAKQIEFTSLQKLVDQINNTEGRNNCNIILLAQPSRGKREAMAMGFALSCGDKYKKVKHPEAQIANLSEISKDSHDFTLNIDSDTRIADKYALLNSILLMENNPEAATLTGDVRVINRNINLLSEMTFQRYWRAFFVERAAQSLSGEVTCMSGPWVLMRNNDLAEILDDWYYQEFLGQRSTYGDDRNISTQMLERGKQSLFCPDSAVETDCPTNWKTFLKQQLRWNKSFNRENLRLFPILQNFDKFVQLDVIYQQTFAFAMLYILSSITGNAISTGLESGVMEGLKTAIPYATIVLIYNELFFGLYGVLSNDKDLKFFLSPVYIGYHFSALLWLKIYAFFKAKDTSWGTKGDDQDLIMEEFNKEKEGMIQEIIEETKNSLPKKDIDT